MIYKSNVVCKWTAQHWWSIAKIFDRRIESNRHESAIIRHTHKYRCCLALSIHYSEDILCVTNKPTHRHGDEIPEFNSNWLVGLANRNDNFHVCAQRNRPQHSFTRKCSSFLPTQTLRLLAVCYGCWAAADGKYFSGVHEMCKLSSSKSQMDIFV